jgi:hypothetical protein
MRYMGFLIHAYQPSTQLERVKDEIYKESYEPVIRTLEENPHICISLDITKSLGERLPREFLERIKNLHSRRQIELVNTAAYHYLLPLVPKEAVMRQLEVNLDFYRKYLMEKKGYCISGFFPPELAFSYELAITAKELNYSWILIDDLLFNQNNPEDWKVPQDYIPTLYQCGLLLRSRLWSERIAQGANQNGRIFARYFMEELTKWQERCRLVSSETFIILALDFETFGHHYKGSIETFFIPFFDEIAKRNGEIKLTELNFIFSHFRKQPSSTKSIYPGSWATSLQDIKNGIPYPLWRHPQNYFHGLWNEFMQIVFAAVTDNISRELEELIYQKAFYSCPPWWAAKSSPQERAIAGWCIPYFKNIIELWPDSNTKGRLCYLLGEMEHWVVINANAP